MAVLQFPPNTFASPFANALHCNSFFLSLLRRNPPIQGLGIIMVDFPNTEIITEMKKLDDEL
jgi:hypothetical protein